jgi:hypothetical protein
MDDVTKLTRAIRGCRVTAGCYATTGPGGVRLLLPHALYETRGGELLLDAIQVAGPTSSGQQLPSWRAFRVDRFSDIEVQDVEFMPSADFSPDADKYVRLLAHCLEGEDA